MSAEPWVTAIDVAQHLGDVKDTVYRWRERKGLPAHEAGRLWKFQLSEVDEWVRERIALGLLAQHEALTASELTTALELPTVEALQPWLKCLLDWHLVQSSGRTQVTRYFVDPGLLCSLNSTGETTLKRIEPHRLAALVLEDLQRYPESAISDIHRRIGGEIHPKQVKRALEELIERGAVRFEGNNRWRRYWAMA